MQTPLNLALAGHANATRWIKKPMNVEVAFARADGVLDTLEGPVRYQAGDALLTGSANERWPVQRAVFDTRYGVAQAGMPPGTDGSYRKVLLAVLALQIEAAFTLRLRDGQLLHGQPGDWLVEYAPGDQAVVANAIFHNTYQPESGALPSPD